MVFKAGTTDGWRYGGAVKELLKSEDMKRWVFPGFFFNYIDACLLLLNPEDNYNSTLSTIDVLCNVAQPPPNGLVSCWLIDTSKIIANWR